MYQSLSKFPLREIHQWPVKAELEIVNSDTSVNGDRTTKTRFNNNVVYTIKIVHPHLNVTKGEENWRIFEKEKLVSDDAKSCVFA